METINEPDLIAAALAYAQRGWAVFPLRPRTKKPFPGSHGFKDATKDEAHIRAWWTEHPAANIGVATGAMSGITVLDVDMKGGRRGDESLRTLEAEHGRLPNTPWQITWSGGRQYVFAYADGIRNSSNVVADGLDIRGDGGYIVVPPSEVTEGGSAGRYMWGADPFSAPLDQMPDWLLERVKSAGAKKGTKLSDVAASENPVGWADEHLANGTPYGSRDETCFKLVSRYVSTKPPLSETEVLGLMEAWATKSVDDVGDQFPLETVREKVARVFAQYADGSLVSYPLTDAGNAERMALLFGDRFRWVVDDEEWLAWDGKRWAPGSIDAVRRFALEAARMLQGAAIRLETGKGKRKVMNHALYSESARGIDGAVRVARVLGAVSITSDSLDHDSGVLNVANGTLNLRTFMLQPHAPRDLLTKVIRVPYDPLAEAPLWEKFLEDVFLGQRDVIEYVQRAVGYTLTGSIEEQCFFLLHGGGANGKSTFVSILTALLGEYATKVDQEAVLTPDRKQRGATPELVVLAGKRLAYVDELEEGRQLDEARIKALTGSERGTGRALYEGMTEWTNTAKLWLDLNHLPAFKGVDAGIERRPKVIPFDRRFEEHEQDKQMAQKLLAELPGVLAWAVEGCQRWRERGLDAPEAVSLRTRQYVEDNNHLPAFVHEQYVMRAGAEVPVSQLQTDYRGWCELRGEAPLDYQRKIVPFLRHVCKLTPSKKHGGRQRVWVGIAQCGNIERAKPSLSAEAAAGEAHRAPEDASP